jgi:hypothetical protein
MIFSSCDAGNTFLTGVSATMAECALRIRIRISFTVLDPDVKIAQQISKEVTASKSSFKKTADIFS